MSARGVLGSSKITRNFQVTIPSQARAKFELKEGDLVLFVSEGEKLIVERA